MRYVITIILSFSFSFVFSQLDVNSTLGLPRVSDTNTNGTINDEIDNETAANIGNLVYNIDDNLIYRFDGTNWLAIEASDDQFDNEVSLRAPLDVNNVIGDPNAGNETTVQQAIQAITPITSKNGRVFYPPSIPIDASVNGTFTLNLYDEYISQHTLPSIIRSQENGGPTLGGTFAPNIPTYAVDELYYYVTFADSDVFGTITIDGDTGLMTYTIVGQPRDFNSLINVVFVVK